MEWTVAEARQRLSELLSQASRQPQIITNRRRPVAAVIDSETFREFEAWRTERNRPTLYDLFEEARRISAEDAYELDVPGRASRPTPFDDELPG